MKNYILAVLAVFMLGCSTLERAADYVNENPLVASVAARQAVARYVEAGDDQKARATATYNVLTGAQNQLSGSPRVTVDEITNAINSRIRWDHLSVSDQTLVTAIMDEVGRRLREKQIQGELPEDTVIAIRSLLQTAISQAGLMR